MTDSNRCGADVRSAHAIDCRGSKKLLVTCRRGCGASLLTCTDYKRNTVAGHNERKNEHWKSMAPLLFALALELTNGLIRPVSKACRRRP